MTFRYAWQRCDAQRRELRRDGQDRRLVLRGQRRRGPTMRLVVVAQNSTGAGFGHERSDSGRPGKEEREDGLAGVQAVPNDEAIGATSGRPARFAASLLRHQRVPGRRLCALLGVL